VGDLGQRIADRLIARGAGRGRELESNVPWKVATKPMHLLLPVFVLVHIAPDPAHVRLTVTSVIRFGGGPPPPNPSALCRPGFPPVAEPT
jgi:hypothetical protein